LLWILRIQAWGYGNIVQDAFSHLEKDEDLGDAIISSKIIFTKKVKVAQDPILWEWESIKTTYA
jgi:hypothetical protein